MLFLSSYNIKAYLTSKESVFLCNQFMMSNSMMKCVLLSLFIQGRHMNCLGLVSLTIQISISFSIPNFNRINASCFNTAGPVEKLNIVIKNLNQIITYNIERLHMLTYWREILGIKKIQKWEKIQNRHW